MNTCQDLQTQRDRVPLFPYRTSWHAHYFLPSFLIYALHYALLQMSWLYRYIRVYVGIGTSILNLPPFENKIPTLLTTHVLSYDTIVLYIKLQARCYKTPEISGDCGSGETV
jgi:hypothetical protein